MDQFKLQLKQDFFDQAGHLLTNQEKLFLSACEGPDTGSLEGIKRLVCLLKGMARSSEFRSAFEMLEEVEKLLDYCLEHFTSLAPKDKEVFIELFDHLNFYFSREAGAKHTDNADDWPGDLLDGIKKSVEKRRGSLSFRIGSSEKFLFEQEGVEVYQLAQDLNVLQKGFSDGVQNPHTLNHLRSLSERLMTLGKRMNEQKISDLYRLIGGSLERKSFKFGFYGGEHKIEKNALESLAGPMIRLMESAYFSSERERIEVLLRASKEGNTRLEAQLSCSKIDKSSLKSFEHELEDLGFQVLSHVDEFSGISLFIDIPQAVNSIEGQVVEVNGQFYAIDLRYVRETIKLTSANLHTFNNKKHYVNYEDRAIPVMALREKFNLTGEDFEGKHAIILEMKGDWAAVPVDRLDKRQALHIKPIDENIVAHEHFRSLCFLDSSLPVFLLDSKKIILEEKARESKLYKFLEVALGSGHVAFETKDIQEIVAYENISLVPNQDNLFYGVMNYQGQPIMVYSLGEKLQITKQSPHENILICKSAGKLFGLTIGSDVAVRTITFDERYGMPAFSHNAPAALFKGAYLRDQKEVVIADVEALSESKTPCGRVPLKKVA